MSDNLKIRRPLDAKKINTHESWEIEYWTKELGVTKQQLLDAVKAVGSDADKVRSHLKRK